jgi:hypothetical protein
MVLRSLIVAVALVAVSALGLQGCSKDAQKVQPETRGKRGETCLARNDCDNGLACINNTCAQNEFNLDVTAKQCIREECQETADCCGNKETEAPAKCADRNAICEQANRLIPGCTQAATCTTANAATVCGAGTCSPGVCQGGGNLATACETAADCKKDTCNLATGYCTVSTSYTCTADSSCPYYLSTVQCSSRTCNCVNPVFNQSDPICTDEDCVDICLLRCQDNLCLEDKSCKSDSQCLALGLQVCDGGRCVECTKNSECDEDNDETCESGVCHKPCKDNEECPLFEACVKGDCVYQGCNDDRECILAASRGLQGVGGSSNAQAAGADDPRLYKCLANDADPDHKTCKIPCENDGSCGQFQVCDAGYCKFVGCDSDEQCRNYLGIANQMTSETKPYVAKAKCVDPVTADK